MAGICMRTGVDLLSGTALSNCVGVGLGEGGDVGLGRGADVEVGRGANVEVGRGGGVVATLAVVETGGGAVALVWPEHPVTTMVMVADRATTITIVGLRRAGRGRLLTIGCRTGR